MPSVSTTVAADRSSVRAARRATIDALAELALAFDEEQVETARLLVSELVTNAVKHGSPCSGGELRIVWSKLGADMLKVTVTDQDGAMPRLRAAAEDDEHGRGLGIVRREATNMGWHPEPAGGKTVWFTLVRTVPTAPGTDESSVPAPALTTAVLRAHGLMPGLRPVPREPEAIPPRRHPARLNPSPAA
ncbi:ATP-binding protein [Kitasatospora purpeofusca]|uniref:ATP-binding protein n=1 Tax=Kitasatospora purpeofusca TaxID=67352 RepID=UPI0038705738|nr:ATP-binding protein [Kitasatospora purpeofusca]